MDNALLRQRMIKEQITARGISDPRLLTALEHVPRNVFVPSDKQDLAYDDCPLPIGEGQTISQPYMVALMTDCLQLEKSDTVLEIGTGSGYQTAILAELAGEVYTIERVGPLARAARGRLESLGYSNVHYYIGDGVEGINHSGVSFDAIIITAASHCEVRSMYGWLNAGGRLAVPIGPRESQTLCLFTKTKKGIIRKDICQCVFVPLISPRL